MTPITILMTCVSQTDRLEVLRETAFKKNFDFLVVPRVGETIMVSNYVIEVFDVLHAPMLPPRIFASIGLHSDDLPTEAQMQMISMHLTQQGWHVEEVAERERSPEEYTDKYIH